MRMIRHFALPFAMLVAGTGTLAAAQSAPVMEPAMDAVESLPEPDPERLAAAERVVNRIWPLGTLRRVTESTVDSTVAMVAGVGEGMATTEWAATDDSKEARRARHEERTGRPLSGTTEGDGAGVMRSSEDVAAEMRRMNEVMLPIFERIEPPIRMALARIYARRYSLAELGELDAFFATPTGARYAADSMTLMNDPEMVQAMASVVGELLTAVPAAMMGLDAQAAGAADADAAADAAGAAVDAAATAAVKVE